jgi:hypothetical protein
MESFSTPQSNKRTATCHRPTHSGIPASRLRWIHAPPGYPPLSCTDLQLLDPHHAGTPPQKTVHRPSGPAEPQLCMGQLGPCPSDSCPAGLQGSSSGRNDWSPVLLGQAPAWHKTATSTSLPGTPPFRQSQPQLYKFPLRAH